MLIYQGRTAAGLTQQELADRIGTSRSAICRLEDSEYRGHSLAMLRRIAEALNCRVRVVLEPVEEEVSQSFTYEATGVSEQPGEEYNSKSAASKKKTKSP